MSLPVVAPQKYKRMFILREMQAYIIVRLLLRGL